MTTAGGTKRCPDCGGQKPLEEFPRHHAYPDGRFVYCKRCHNARNRASKQRNGGARRYHLRARYGLEPSDVEALIARQGGLCAACRRPAAEQVDHDHRTGRVRGILCLRCNAALGAFKDDPVRIQRAIAYLESFPRGKV